MGWSIKLLSPFFLSSSVKPESMTHSQSQVLFKWGGGWCIIFTSPYLSFLIDSRDNFSTLQSMFCYCRYDIDGLPSPINSLLAMASVIHPVSTHPSSTGNSNTHPLCATLIFNLLPFYHYSSLHAPCTLPLHQWVSFIPHITPFLPQNISLSGIPHTFSFLKKTHLVMHPYFLCLCLYCLILVGFSSVPFALTPFNLERWACFPFTFPLNMRGWWCEGQEVEMLQRKNYGEKQVFPKACALLFLAGMQLTKGEHCEVELSCVAACVLYFSS